MQPASVRVSCADVRFIGDVHHACREVSVVAHASTVLAIRKRVSKHTRTCWERVVVEKLANVL